MTRNYETPNGGKIYAEADLNFCLDDSESLVAGKDTDRMRRFVRDAQSAAALKHPNITIHEIGESDGTHFIVAEYVVGGTH